MLHICSDYQSLFGELFHEELYFFCFSSTKTNEKKNNLLDIELDTPTNILITVDGEDEGWGERGLCVT